MFDKITETVSQLLQQEDDVLAVFLFGSRARGDYQKTSDYDFYVLLDKNTKDSLREDELSKQIFQATKRFRITVHLTFQYLFILDDDKSLLLKISSEGVLLFSKAYIIAPYKQIGLHRYFICRWELDQKKLLPKDKTAKKTAKLLINRLLYGYEQKYTYQGKERTSKKKGVIDNQGIFGAKDIVIVLDAMYGHLAYLIKEKKGKIHIIKTCYLPEDNQKMLDKYIFKRDIEILLRKREQIADKIFIKSIRPQRADSIEIIYHVVDGSPQKIILPTSSLPHKHLPRSGYVFG